MLSGNPIFRCLRQFGLIAAVAGLTLGSLQAQSNSSTGSTAAAPALGAASPGPITTPESTPIAPADTRFSSASADPNTVSRPDTRVAQNVDANYRIGADDLLAINVWHEPEVSRNVPVRPDGNISLPLIGDVRASGLTPTELQRELEARFAKYLTDPAVSVMVAEIRSQRINVLGQVMRPGTYPLIPPMSVIDAIAAAGGLKEFAKAKQIYLLRTLPNGQRERIPFQYKNVLSGKHGAKDILLQTRDTVVVP